MKPKMSLADAQIALKVLGYARAKEEVISGKDGASHYIGTVILRTAHGHDAARKIALGLIGRPYAVISVRRQAIGNPHHVGYDVVIDSRQVNPTGFVWQLRHAEALVRGIDLDTPEERAGRRTLSAFGKSPLVPVWHYEMDGYIGHITAPAASPARHGTLLKYDRVYKILSATLGGAWALLPTGKSASALGILEEIAS